MFSGLLRDLDRWAIEKDAKDRADGLPGLSPCTIRLVGQMALLEQELPLTLVATQDLDVKADYEWPLEQKFGQLVEEQNLTVDPDGHLVWMPKGTRYLTVYTGRFVTGKVAEADFVLVSKALKAPEKNRTIIVEYLAKGASERFFRLAEENRVDLEKFL